MKIRLLLPKFSRTAYNFLNPHQIIIIQNYLLQQPCRKFLEARVALSVKPNVYMESQRLIVKQKSASLRRRFCGKAYTDFAQ